VSGLPAASHRKPGYWAAYVVEGALDRFPLLGLGLSLPNTPSALAWFFGRELLIISRWSQARSAKAA
jgi:hypothetical protein